jgi:hypothetical protein
VKCPVCDHEFTDQANFCPNCGTAVRRPGDPPETGGAKQFAPQAGGGPTSYYPQGAGGPMAGGPMPYAPPPGFGGVTYRPPPGPKAEVRPLDWARYRQARILYIVAAASSFACSMVGMTLVNIWDPGLASGLQRGLVLGFLSAAVGFFILLAIATGWLGSVLGFTAGNWVIALVFLFCFSLISMGYMIYKMDEAQKTGLAAAGERNKCQACGRRIKAGAAWCPQCGAQLR